MSVKEILDTVQFVVDQEGKPKAAILTMQAWQAFLDLLEDIEDKQLIHERFNGWRQKEGWSRWEDVEAELNQDEAPTMA